MSAVWNLHNEAVLVRVDEARGTVSFTDAAARRTPVPAAYAAVEWSAVHPRRTETRALGFARPELRRVTDAHGPGTALALPTMPCSGSPALTFEVALYDEQPFASLRLSVTNTLDVPIRLERFHVLVTPLAPRGRLALGGDPAAWTVYQHGWQSWSPTGAWSGRDLPYPEMPPVLSPDGAPSAPGRLTSHGVSAVRSPETGQALTLGFVTASDYLGAVWWDLTAAHVDARCEADGMVLAPGATATSERLILDLTPDVNAALTRYAAAQAREMGANPWDHPPSGWCSWYYYFTSVTEADVVENLEFLSAHREALPLEYVQLDDGYQADIGDWAEWNGKFPHGPRWLADRIASEGFRPGLWLAPFLVAESSRLYREHPDWVVRTPSGAPVLAIRNWERDCYALDTTHPDALAWLEGLFRTVVHDWGYTYAKIDFVFAAAVAGLRHDPSATRAQAYRRGIEAIRRAVGNAFILGCGAPLGPSAGIVNGMRIGPDVAPWWRFRTSVVQPPDAARAERRRLAGNPATESAIRNTLTRSWAHGILWQNDPDCLMVRDARTKLTEAEVRSFATAVGLSGGMVLVSDRLPDVPPERLRIISQLLPVVGAPAVPLDLMDAEMPALYALDMERPWGRWRLLAAFNWEDAPADLRVPLPAEPCHVFEFWSGRYLGVHRTAMTVPEVPAHGAALLSTRAVRNRPQVVGSTLHVSQGGAELAGADWDGRRLTLRLSPVPARQGNLYVAANGHRLASAGGPLTAPVSQAGGVIVLPVRADVSAGVVLEFEREV